MTGKQSLLFDKDVYVRCTATVVGKKEADGPLGEMFDVAVECLARKAGRRLRATFRRWRLTSCLLKAAWLYQT